jgi:hypothetical protein
MRKIVLFDKVDAHLKYVEDLNSSENPNTRLHCFCNKAKVKQQQKQKGGLKFLSLTWLQIDLLNINISLLS